MRYLIFFVNVAIILTMSACEIGIKEKPAKGALSSWKNLARDRQIVWNFAQKYGETLREQWFFGANHSFENNNECLEGEALKIYTKANSYQRNKGGSKNKYRSGLYTWRTYISDLGKNEQVSIGSWLYNDEEHGIVFEVCSGKQVDREELNLQADEVIVFMSSQDKPKMRKKNKIKKNAWHLFQIDLLLVDGKYLATWLIDGKIYLQQQLEYGEEYPFLVACSTENLRFTGDIKARKNNYGLWDYISYTPYNYPKPAKIPDRPKIKPKINVMESWEKLVKDKQIIWNFAQNNEDAMRKQWHFGSNNSFEDNNDSQGGVLKIYTRAHTYQRNKAGSKTRYGAGLYTWRTYISNLSENEQVSIGSWLYHDDRHELDFEIGSGKKTDREEFGLKPDEVIAFITSQANPWLHEKIKIKKNTWHIFQIDLQLINGKYCATWLIDGEIYVQKQLDYGEEYPFIVACSTENLRFTGNIRPRKNNYGLWDYVSYIPYPYSIEPVSLQHDEQAVVKH